MWEDRAVNPISQYLGHGQGAHHSHDTRQQNQLRTNLTRTKYADNTLRNHLPVLVNGTPLHILQKIRTHSIYGFSSSVKQYYLNMYRIDCSIHPKLLCMSSIKSIYVLCKIEKDNHWNRYVAALIRFHHCLRWGLSEWQLPVQSVMGVWSEWRGFSFRWCVMRLEPLLFVFNYIFYSFTD